MLESGTRVAMLKSKLRTISRISRNLVSYSVGYSKTAAFWAAFLLMTVAAFPLITLTGCSSLQDLFGTQPQLNSFMGVNFGDQKNDVMTMYPAAREETSPYGAESVRLTKVHSSVAEYNYVLFEFLWRGGGMQLVMAGFGPASANAIRDNLQAHLGAPKQLAVASSYRQSELRWLLDDGTDVTFNAREGLLVIVGPRGKVLEGDVNARLLRQANDLPS